MSKKISVLRFILAGVLFLGFSVQIVLGLSWMFGNFLVSQAFPQDNGILYPILVYIAKGVGSVIPIPYYCFLYVLQLSVAFGACFYLVGVIKKTSIIVHIWASLVLLTYPFAMQCHLAALPDSLVSSCFLLELAVLTDCVKNESKIPLHKLSLSLPCMLFSGLLASEYVILSGVAVVLLLFVAYIKENNITYFFYSALLVGACIGMLAGITTLASNSRSYAFFDMSSNYKAMARCSWPVFDKEYDLWPEDAKEIISRENAYAINYYPENIQLKLKNPLEEKLGSKRAEQIYGEIASLSWENHTGAIIHDTAWDILGYVFSPMVVERQLAGKVYEACTGVNYENMRRNNPILTGMYLRYGDYWFGVAMVILVLVILVRNELIPNAKSILAFVATLIPLLTAAIYYSLQGAGIMDYKKTIYIGIMWILLELNWCLKGLEDSDV